MLEKIILPNKNVYVNSKILDIVHKRKIEKLIHFTNIKNLESILRMGICTRRYLRENEIKYEYNDPHRKDRRRDCSSFSIEYPNTGYLFKLINNTENKFCIIILDAEKLLPNILDKYYVYCNAATTEASSYLSSEALTQPKFFENMFYDSKVSYLPKDVQSEVLIKGNVSTKYIQEIHFMNNDDLEEFKNICKKLDFENKYTFKVSDLYFKDREQINWVKR